MSTQILAKIKDYFVGSISEMKKVIWPNKKQIKIYTVLVIAMSLGVALFFGVLDYIFNLGLGQFIQ